MNNKRNIIIICLAVVVLILAGVFIFTKKDTAQPVSNTPKPTPAPKYNLIPVSQRPYISLTPLTARNELQFEIFNLPLEATAVDVALEYDRNEGVWDSVLRTFSISQLPFQDNFFMGSKSAGGHITYHDDVIGGDIVMEFSGGEQDYDLKTLWRYDDTQSPYQQFSTADGKFQISFDQPYQTPKMLAMLSPGSPKPVESQIVAGPYLFRGVTPYTDSLELTIRLDQATDSAQLIGWDGQAWQSIESQLVDKTVTAETTYFDAYLITAQ